MAVGPRRGLNLRGNIRPILEKTKKTGLPPDDIVLLHIGVQAATAQGWKLSPLGLL